MEKKRTRATLTYFQNSAKTMILFELGLFNGVWCCKGLRIKTTHLCFQVYLFNITRVIMLIVVNLVTA